MINPQGFLPGVGVDGGGWSDLYSLLPGFNFDSPDDLRKAITAGYGTDVAALTGGAALRLQSLEGTLLTSVQENDDFVLFNQLEKTNATATVDEYSVKERIGGYPGAAFSGETDDIPEDAGSYERKVGLVKFLMTQRQVSAVQRSQKTLVDTMADQNVDGTLELLTSLEWGCFYGRSACSSVEFDGILAQLETLGGDHVLDLRGQSITALGTEIVDSARFIRSYGNFGKLTDAFMSPAMQSDFDLKLDPAVRVMLNGGDPSKVKIGTPVPGIKTSFGNIDFRPDIFVQEGEMPFESRGGNFLANVAAANCTAPSSVAVTPAPTSGSLWTTSQEGLYYWGVEGGNKLGRSALVKSSQQAIQAGDGASLVITHGASTATFFVLYRSRKNGTDASDDFREMIRVPRSSGATTTYVDLNQNIPGCSHIFLVTMAPGRKAITLRRLLPLTRFPLYPTNKAVYPWALLLFAYLRLAKVKQHRVVKNCLPSTQTWRPFGV